MSFGLDWSESFIEVDKSNLEIKDDAAKEDIPEVASSDEESSSNQSSSISNS